MRWLALLAAVSVLCGLIVRSLNPPPHPTFQDWETRMASWTKRCDQYYGETWAEPHRKACDLEMAGLQAEGRRNGWILSRH